MSTVAQRFRRGRSGTSRLLVVVLAGTMLLDALEVSVLLPVLPQFDVAPGEAQWLMSGFALGFGLVLPAGPRLAARYGRRRVYLAALVCFTVASTVAGVTGDFGVLIACRLIKGACAALTASGGLAVLAAAVPDGPRQRRVVAQYAAFGAAGFTAGLLASGILAGSGTRWVLLFPAPAALVLLACAIAVVPADGLRVPVAQLSWRSAREGVFLRSAFGAATLNGTYLATLVTTTYALHERQGWSPLAVAAGCLPACLPVALVSPFAARLVAVAGTARLIALGAVATVTGYAWQLSPSIDMGYSRLLPTLLLVGLGFALSFGALNMQVLAAVPAADRGRVVPLYQSCVQFGAVALLVGVVAMVGLDGPLWMVITAVGAAGAYAALVGVRNFPTAENRGGIG
ncbi:MFS transporter [Amycolatopsis sp. H20-H5]|uniref:MFS transporter n=1 Tax=Amycolatopsis sp. H20-H5 TaxID=3046309 RepID=UPI002DBE3D8F|nr:MFS transporter [Amycolatopsis sp. H20-H5]MEC3975519.1 MFS transporter [Amycolatopsis sp. H20-H5]